MKFNMKLAVLLMVVAAVAAKPFPESYELQDSRNVQEVEPEARKQTLEDFRGKSILYRSLFPQEEGQTAYEFVVEVESPVLVLKKPKNVALKRQQVALKRVSEEE